MCLYFICKSIKNVCYVADIFFEEVDIGIVGYFHRGMTEKFTDDFYINPFREEHTGEGMTERVDTKITVEGLPLQF